MAAISRPGGASEKVTGAAGSLTTGPAVMPVTLWSSSAAAASQQRGTRDLVRVLVCATQRPQVAAFEALRRHRACSGSRKGMKGSRTNDAAGTSAIAAQLRKMGKPQVVPLVQRCKSASRELRQQLELCREAFQASNEAAERAVRRGSSSSSSRNVQWPSKQDTNAEDQLVIFPDASAPPQQLKQTSLTVSPKDPVINGRDVGRTASGVGTSSASNTGPTRMWLPRRAAPGSMASGHGSTSVAAGAVASGGASATAANPGSPRNTGGSSNLGRSKAAAEKVEPATVWHPPGNEDDALWKEMSLLVEGLKEENPKWAQCLARVVLRLEASHASCRKQRDGLLEAAVVFPTFASEASPAAAPRSPPAASGEKRYETAAPPVANSPSADARDVRGESIAQRQVHTPVANSPAADLRGVRSESGGHQQSAALVTNSPVTDKRDVKNEAASPSAPPLSLAAQAAALAAHLTDLSSDEIIFAGYGRSAASGSKPEDRRRRPSAPSAEGHEQSSGAATSGGGSGLAAGARTVLMDSDQGDEASKAPQTPQLSFGPKPLVKPLVLPLPSQSERSEPTSGPPQRSPQPPPVPSVQISLLAERGEPLDVPPSRQGDSAARADNATSADVEAPASSSSSCSDEDSGDETEDHENGSPGSAVAIKQASWPRNTLPPPGPTAPGGRAAVAPNTDPASLPPTSFTGRMNGLPVADRRPTASERAATAERSGPLLDRLSAPVRSPRLAADTKAQVAKARGFVPQVKSENGLEASSSSHASGATATAVPSTNAGSSSPSLGGTGSFYPPSTLYTPRTRAVQQQQQQQQQNLLVATEERGDIAEGVVDALSRSANSLAQQHPHTPRQKPASRIGMAPLRTQAPRVAHGGVSNGRGSLRYPPNHANRPFAVQRMASGSLVQSSAQPHATAAPSPRHNTGPAIVATSSVAKRGTAVRATSASTSPSRAGRHAPASSPSGPAQSVQSQWAAAAVAAAASVAAASARQAASLTGSTAGQRGPGHVSRQPSVERAASATLPPSGPTPSATIATVQSIASQGSASLTQSLGSASVGSASIATSDPYAPYLSAGALSMGDPTRWPTASPAPALSPTAGNTVERQSSAVTATAWTTPANAGAVPKLPTNGLTSHYNSMGAPPPQTPVPVGSKGYSSIQLWTPRAHRQPVTDAKAAVPREPRELSVEPSQVGRSPSASLQPSSMSPRSYAGVNMHAAGAPSTMMPKLTSGGWRV